MKILVRLPNWLGDMVMSVGFMNQLPHFFPGAQVSVIAKKGIHELISFFPATVHRFVFDKEVYKGVKGLIRFGNEVQEKERFDIFFCLPDSFSSAVMAMATGSSRRVGYKKEMRQILLTDAYSKPEGLHRVEEYVQLLKLYCNATATPISVRLQHQIVKGDYIVVNINSEASSRRLTTQKAVELLNLLRNKTQRQIILTGAPGERDFVQQVLDAAMNPANIKNMAGQTTLSQLAALLAGAHVMLTTDSGPAHLSNALGTHTIILFGAGNENNTAPYNNGLRTIIRLGQLSCEPCLK